MMCIKKYFVCVLVIAFSVGLLGFSTVHADKSEGKVADNPIDKIYFTSTNIWYETPNKIPSTNYHKGSKLPLGTKVKIVGYNGRKIEFKPVDATVTFTIVQQRKHSIIKLKELFDRYFSKKSVLAKGGYFHDLTEKEKENVKNGSIFVGMSKVAVPMAYGYPPSHKTPLLSSDLWYYWHSRLQNIIVHFKNNKICKIERVEQVELEYVSGE